MFSGLYNFMQKRKAVERKIYGQQVRLAQTKALKAMWVMYPSLVRLGYILA